jgi:hypothetical protein
MPYFAGHGLIAPSTIAAVNADCDPAADAPSAACSADFDLAHNQIGNVNIYNIYGDCVTGRAAGRADIGGQEFAERIGEDGRGAGGEFRL